MASVYDLKPKFQQLLKPLISGLASAGVTANQVTIFALVISFAAGGILYFNPTETWPLLMLPGVLFVRMALNAIDGQLARNHHMQSDLGAVLNEMGDVLSDMALYLPFAVLPGFSPFYVVLIVIFSVVGEMMGVVAVQIGAGRRYDGPFGKSDRAFVFGLIALVIGLGMDPQPWLNWLLPILLILSVLTIINRAKKALNELDKSAT